MTNADRRAAALKARRAQQADSPPEPVATGTEAARAHFVGASVVEALTQGRAVQSLPIDQVAPELQPQLRQPRLLPLPEELRNDGQWDEQERPLIDELLALGESMRERQIQPIVVHAGSSERYPGARYLIVVGHRRWTAAALVGLPTIDAIIIDSPSPETLVAIQFSENEDRAEFCDMERAWALERMRQILPDTPWETIETRFRLSESRRKQLMRLTTFTPQQQRLVARLRASEFQLRPLHTAIREGGLDTAQADRVFAQLVTHATSNRSTVAGAESTAPPATLVLDQATVSRLVARSQKAEATASIPHPRWVAPLQQSMQQTRSGLERAAPKVGDLDEATLDALEQEVGALLSALETMVSTLAARERTEEGDA
ncbi:ParB N-terminal domain-containing protein [Chloroflexales bacterium ZM16-3]|nr:ParB N-terminal domain-containing protein [Chloroflexales bacterium ZM16-3]